MGLHPVSERLFVLFVNVGNSCACCIYASQWRDIMAYKTFISYKWSEAKDLRDRIICALGDDATYYQGEHSESADLTDKSNDTIKEKLKDMIYDTSVTIVVLSPKMKTSKWIEWEIRYSLRKIRRRNQTSQINGIVAVIQKSRGGYSWFKKTRTDYHDKSVVYYNMDEIFDIIARNHFNSNPPQWHCDQCRTYDRLNGSYIAFVDEEEFLSNPKRFIDNAYEKSRNNASKYDIVKTTE